jgi:hypothetical protein
MIEKTKERTQERKERTQERERGHETKPCIAETDSPRAFAAPAMAAIPAAPRGQTVSRRKTDLRRRTMPGCPKRKGRNRMKTNGQFGKRLAFLLAFFLLLTGLCSAAAADPLGEAYLQFGAGVDWDTTPSRAGELEGVTGDEQINAHTVGDFVQYSFIHRRDDGSKEYVFYVFNQEKLVIYGANTTFYVETGDLDLSAAFDAERGRLTGQYGEPAISDKQRLIALYNVIDERGITEEEIESFAGWDLGGGTELYLFNILNDSTIYLYANPYRLLGDGAPAPAAETSEAPGQQSGPDEDVDWGTSISRMREIEGVTQDNEPEMYSVGDFTQYGFRREADEGALPAYIYYIFKLERLVMYGCSFDSYMLPDGTDLEEIYGAQLARLSEKYGEPSIDDKQRFIRLMDVLDEGSLHEGDIEQIAGWDLGNGTELYLLNALGDSIIYIYADSEELLKTGE